MYQLPKEYKYALIMIPKIMNKTPLFHLHFAYNQLSIDQLQKKKNKEIKDTKMNNKIEYYWQQKK